MQFWGHAGALQFAAIHIDMIYHQLQKDCSSVAGTASAKPANPRSGGTLI
jgi:hypothetical protein